MMAIEDMEPLMQVVRLTDLQSIKLMVVAPEIVVVLRDGRHLHGPVSPALAKRLAKHFANTEADMDDEFKVLLAMESEAA